MLELTQSLMRPAYTTAFFLTAVFYCLGIVISEFEELGDVLADTPLIILKMAIYCFVIGMICSTINLYYGGHWWP